MSDEHQPFKPAIPFTTSAGAPSGASGPEPIPESDQRAPLPAGGQGSTLRDRFEVLQRRRASAARGSEARRACELRADLLGALRAGGFEGEDERAALAACHVDLALLHSQTEAEAVARRRKGKHGASALKEVGERGGTGDTADKRTDGASLCSTTCNITDVPPLRREDFPRPGTSSPSNPGVMTSSMNPGVAPSPAVDSLGCGEGPALHDGATNDPPRHLYRHAGKQAHRQPDRHAHKQAADTAVAPSAWQALRPYLHVNAHQSVSSGSGARRASSGLEESMEGSLAAGDVDGAVALSDRLALRQLGVDVCAAVDAQRFVVRRRDEERMRVERRRKKLAWGFQPKHRWETKGNM